MSSREKPTLGVVAAKMTVLIGITGLIVYAGGGLSFLARPMGVPYVVLWIFWGYFLARDRGKGSNSEYERSQSRVMLAFGVIFTAVFFGAPWEYVTYSGPIPRDGLIAWLGVVLFLSGDVLQW